MRWLRNDRGAVGVMVALIIIPLLACAALVVDFGAYYLRKAEVQNAADAVAVAIAQDCASGRATCSTSTTWVLTGVTKKIADDNVQTGPATSVVKLNAENHFVTVSTTSIVNYAFAPAIGISQPGTVAAQASARWGAPTVGQPILPIAFSWCSFKTQTGGGVPTPANESVKIKFSKSADLPCTGPSGNEVPGGFGFLKVDSSSSCVVSPSIIASTGAIMLESQPGNSTKCEDFFSQQIGKPALLPLFASDKTGAGGSGAGAWYKVYTYAAFRITAFYFQGNDNWVEGSFVVFVDPSDAFALGAGGHDLGGRIVTLCTLDQVGTCS